MKILIACGSGVATSTVIADKVERLLKKNGLKAQVIQCTMNDVQGNLNGATLVVSALPKLEAKGVPVILALSYITGINTEATDAEIEKILLANKDN
jgi:PTS system galactitol-specific IIB component